MVLPWSEEEDKLVITCGGQRSKLSHAERRRMHWSRTEASVKKQYDLLCGREGAINKRPNLCSMCGAIKKGHSCNGVRPSIRMPPFDPFDFRQLYVIRDSLDQRELSVDCPRHAIHPWYQYPFLL